MSYLDISNAFAIERNHARVEAMQLLYETDKKAEYINDQFNVKVPSYYEYKMDNPVPEPGMQLGTVVQGGTVGSLIGAVASVAFSEELSVGATLAGAGLGTLVGVDARDDGSQIGLEHLQRYNQFLDVMAGELTREFSPGNQIIDVKAELMQPRMLEASTER